MRTLLFLIPALWANASAQVPDSAGLFRAARAAEAEYERAARRLAPLGSSEPAGTCDEYVGRFCLYYDSGRDPLPAEPVEIARFRHRAIERLRAALEVNHVRPATVLPLIRLLLEHKRPGEALEVARRFSAVSADSVTSSMLLTLTHHANGEITAAERAIERWLSVVDSTERRRLQDLRWLLESREEKRYRTLTDDSVDAYVRRFWRYADALYLTEGNETRTEHFSRHAENRLMQTVPAVFGATSFGKDVAELTIRFGTPKARTRSWRSSIGTSEPQITEHWDPEQMIYAAPAMDTVLRIRPGPALGWPMDTIRSISGHAPPTIRRMLPLEHQAAVFRDASGEHVLLVSAVLPKDSIARSSRRFRAGLFLTGPELVEQSRRVVTATSASDSLRTALELPIPNGAVFYSVEILEEETRLAGRARFPLVRPIADRGLFLSDLLVADSFPPGEVPTGRGTPTLVVRPSLILAAGRPFGVYAEVSPGTRTPDSITVELELIAADGSNALLAAVRWLGQQIGVTGRPPPRRMSWTVQLHGPGPTPIAVTIDPGNLKTGRYIVEMAAAHAGRRAIVRREVLFTASETSSRRP